MTKIDQELMAIVSALAPGDQASLLAFARFLAQQNSPGAASREDGSAAVMRQQPENIPRPPQETVVGALKRLTATYPMLDKAKLLNETSGLVAQHIMHGRDLVTVIDELEAIFKNAYQKYSDA
jgi:hypothetical protein